MLDMGCGSGILAMAMAKTWAAHTQPVVAVDYDATAVQVAQANIRRNQAHEKIRCLRGSAYTQAAVRRHGPYGLIVANILARPLVRMARGAAAALAPGGHIILSGILREQMHTVCHAYRMQGLRLLRHEAHRGWSSLLLGNPRRVPCRKA